MRRQAQRFAVWVAVLYILAAKGSDAVSLSEVPQIRLKTSYENHGETWALARQPVFLDVEIDNDVLETVGKNHSLRLLYLHATKMTEPTVVLDLKISSILTFVELEEGVRLIRAFNVEELPVGTVIFRAELHIFDPRNGAVVRSRPLQIQAFPKPKISLEAPFQNSILKGGRTKVTVILENRRTNFMDYKLCIQQASGWLTCDAGPRRPTALDDAEAAELAAPDDDSDDNDDSDDSDDAGVYTTLRMVVALSPASYHICPVIVSTERNVSYELARCNEWTAFDVVPRFLSDDVARAWVGNSVVRTTWDGDGTTTKRGKHGTFKYHMSDVYIGRSLHYYGEWSDREVSLFAHLIGPGSTVIDAGANIGAFTVAFSNMVGSSGKVIALEPSSESFALLKANLKLNSITNVEAHKVAVGKETVALEVDDPRASRNNQFNSGGFSVSNSVSRPQDVTSSAEARGSADRQSVDKERIDMKRLDDFVDEHPEITRIDFIKADVEGSELDLLHGGAITIQRFRPFLYLENDRMEGSSALLRQLKQLQYAVFWSVERLYNEDNFFNEPKNIFQDEASYNILCVPNEKLLAADKRVFSLFQAFEVSNEHPSSTRVKRNMLFSTNATSVHPLVGNAIMTIQDDLALQERKVFSMNGEDGVLEGLFSLVGVTNKFFVEFYVGDGSQCNTRNLRERHQGWSGVMFDTHYENTPINLYREAVTAENVVEILARKYRVPRRLDLLSISVGYNEFWILKALFDSKHFRPRVLVVEVNSKINKNESLTTPYNPTIFARNLGDFHGVSVLGLGLLAVVNDYDTVYCESTGFHCFLLDRALFGTERGAITRSLGGVNQIFSPQRLYGFPDFQRAASSQDWSGYKEVVVN